ncbi:MAG: DUF5615 family PIN-like protein [Dehalococcoidia bacterium]
MVERLRLYLDENVSQRIAEALVRLGLDVLTVRDAGRTSQPDEAQLAHAASLNRVLVTHDRGIRDTHWRHQPHGGVFFAPQETAAQAVVDWLELACSVLTAEEMGNRLEVYSP